MSRRRNKIEEFKKKYQHIIERVKVCSEDTNKFNEICKDMDIVDLAIFDAFEALQYAEKLKDIISIVYELAWVKEWSGSGLVKYAVDEMIGKFISYGLIDKLSVKHAEAIAKYRKVKALFDALPTKKFKQHILYHIINKILEISESEETEDGKIMLKIDKEKLVKMMYEPPVDTESILDNEVVSKKIIEGFNKVYSKEDKNESE